MAVMLCLALCLPGLATAKKLYRYQDAEGIWHFTDKAPEPGIQADSVQMEVGERPQRVLVRNRGSSREPLLYVTNTFHGPAEIELRFAQMRNVGSDPVFPLRLTVPPRGEIKAARLWISDPQQNAGYTLEYSYTPGPPGAVHDDAQPYRPPFDRGQSFYIAQAFGGRFSHTHPQSAYAVDLAMPEGTPIRAARAGIVMDVANDYFNGGDDLERYIDRANFIRILHDDGSMAVYAHLALETARVTAGSRVQRGQVIGASGNTGFSTGPHLHFAVQVNRGMELVSVPFAFSGQDGAGVTPIAGEVLTAFD